jgi:integrase
MMGRGLTVRGIEAIKPAKHRREIPDGYLSGLYFVVQPTGARAWAVRYRHAGRTRKHTLGSYPALDLKAARELGSKALRTVAEGKDPATEKARARSAQANSIDSVIGEFVAKHCRRNNRPRTAEETERTLRLHVLPRWRGRMVHDIAKRDVIDVLDRLVDAGTPIAANRTLAVVRKLFNWCVARDILSISPCMGVKPPSEEKSRDRTLSDRELKQVWLAADKIGWPFGPMLKMLILTGQRRDEVARMMWAEVDLDNRLWTLPRERVKNNEPHEVPLSDEAIAILKSVPRIEDSPYIFTTTGASPSSSYSRNKRRLDALARIAPWRLHDLRRTVATGMARLGINLPVIEKVLNHASGSFAGIVGVYQRHSFAEEKRQALAAWGKHVEGLQ